MSNELESDIAMVMNLESFGPDPEDSEGTRTLKPGRLMPAASSESGSQTDGCRACSFNRPGGAISIGRWPTGSFESQVHWHWHTGMPLPTAAKSTASVT